MKIVFLSIIIMVFNVNSFATEFSFTQITENAYSDNTPQINIHGDVVWQAQDDLFYYNGQSVVRITNDTIKEKGSQISDNGNVVWYGGDSTKQNEIYVFDGTEIRQITHFMTDGPRSTATERSCGTGASIRQSMKSSCMTTTKSSR